MLEMVTEKYLLRSEAEWRPRRSDRRLSFDRGRLVCGQRAGDRRRHDAELLRPHPNDHSLGVEPLHRDADRADARESSAPAFWGFLMLGGISGGGMGFIFDPRRKTEAQDYLQDLMRTTKRRLQNALPFAMEPVVYDFAINDRGTVADALEGDEALMPRGLLRHLGARVAATRIRSV